MATEKEISAHIEAPRETESQTGVQIEQPDLAVEKLEQFSEKASEAPDEAAALAQAVQAAAPAIKSVISEYEERERQIENFLSRGLEDIYLGLPLEKQAEFRLAGEETAKKINKLLEKTKINIGKIVSLIRKWLSIIPGVNKYFLEQEAKIKTDEILKLRRKE
jgi:hypothetical protein